MSIKYINKKFGPKHIRRSYSKSFVDKDVDNLIDFQIKSYNWFVNEAIKESFENTFPIFSPKKNLELEFKNIIKPKKTKNEELELENARKKGETYNFQIQANVNLIDNATGEITSKEVNFGNIPKMTKTGTFIINGIEKIVVSQLLRSPGAYYGRNVTTKRKGLFNTMEIIPKRGMWIDIFHKLNKKDDIIKISLDKTKAIPLSTFLIAMEFSNKLIIELFGDSSLIKRTIEKNKYKDKDSALKHIYSILRTGDRITKESLKKIFYNFLFNSRRYSLIKTGRFMLNKKFRLRERIVDNYLAQDLKDKDNNVIFAKNIYIDAKVAEKIDKSFNSGILKKRKLSDKEINFKDIYNLDEKEDITKKEKERIKNLKKRRHISIVKVYKDFDNKSNKKNIMNIIGNDNLANEEHLLIPDLIAAISYYINLSDDIIGDDDQDSLEFKRIVSVGEILQNQFQIALFKLEKNAIEKMSIKTDSETSLTINKIVNNKAIQNRFKTFFNSSQLCQFMDQVNPLSEISNKRRITQLGPGGLNKDTGTFKPRDVQDTHFGRICPNESPEGLNIGLILNLANYARVNNYGFIETPYYKVKNGVILKDQIEYLSVYDEVDKIFAESTVNTDENGKILDKQIVARLPKRRNIEYASIDVKDIDFICVSSKQIVSIASSCVPFIENNDANRTLMAANMQRQAVPLIASETPLVGTGMESEIGKWSSFNIKNEEDGIIKYVDSKKIIVNKKTYRLKNFLRSNQGTLIHQRPIVSINQKVKKDEIIADGSSFDNSELALGKNVVVAFTTWKGYNFEDAIIISERLVKEDVFTSIHIEEQIIQFRKSKIGFDELTRDIPNVSIFARRNLDENGIVRIGSEVKPGDVLVGRVSPKGEDNSHGAKEQLLMQILGKKHNSKKDTSLKVKIGHGGTITSVKKLSREFGDKLPDGIEKIIKISIAKKRKIKVGDKMAGRHGNKGVISRVLPNEDMPHLADGTLVDIMLNPQGIPSRMNIGQVLESHLGIAAKNLNIKFASPVFDGIKYEEIKEVMKEANLPTNGKYDLYDPIFGKKFEGQVAIGVMYMLKLNHMIDDKVHARSIGPYSLITQQPLGGKSQNGGQRFGEMEAWAIEAYGAANVLQELLTYKSDDIDGRNKLYKAIVNNTKYPSPGIPESFKVLSYELRGLSMKISINYEENKERNE